MARFKCVKKCFYQNRLWSPGDAPLELPDGSSCPPHFKEVKLVEKKIMEEVTISSPKTLSELQSKMAAEEITASGLGHNEETQKAADDKERKADEDPDFLN